MHQVTHRHLADELRGAPVGWPCGEAKAWNTVTCSTQKWWLADGFILISDGYRVVINLKHGRFKPESEKYLKSDYPYMIAGWFLYLGFCLLAFLEFGSFIVGFPRWQNVWPLLSWPHRSWCSNRSWVFGLAKGYGGTTWYNPEAMFFWCLRFWNLQIENS